MGLLFRFPGINQHKDEFGSDSTLKMKVALRNAKNQVNSSILRNQVNFCDTKRVFLIAKYKKNCCSDYGPDYSRA